ncbi:MAG: hypothetical protein HUJ51_05605 [Eggerthellaceae bacterium]|nr:hypothetical protein [Eggerthellaceae bacterium]
MLNSLPLWESCVLDRAKTQYMILENYTYILFWSLGNESYVGDVLAKMNAFYKESAMNCLTHYEGACRRPGYRDRIFDVGSLIYGPSAKCTEYCEKDGSKPFILREYMHNMGNLLWT